jgi:hypothetical protein
MTGLWVMTNQGSEERTECVDNGRWDQRQSGDAKEKASKKQDYQQEQHPDSIDLTTLVIPSHGAYS